MMARFYFLILLVTVIINCKEERKKWVFERKIELPKNTRPLAIAGTESNFLWVSDPSNMRLLLINQEGKVQDSISGIKRPMNIDYKDGKLFVPEFLTDTIWVFEKGEKIPQSILAQPKAPAGISVNGDTILIADFFNHRIILQIGNDVMFIGEEGNDKGQLYYPTDMKILEGKIYVADAYNHRIQVFSINGNLLSVFGREAKLNVASAIDLNKNLLAVTDQENSRVLIYDTNENLLQIIQSNINYPTDILLHNNQLYISNFRENYISIYIQE